jgi:hypothetical protein
MISLDAIDRLTGAELGTFDLPCPICSPHRSTPANRRKPVLRIWRVQPGFATYYCVHCGEHGHVLERKPADPATLAKARAKAAERDRIHNAARLSKTKWLWSVRMPPERTIVETYLREARGYRGPLPATLGFLPSRGNHPPAMIAAFGMATEPEPGRLGIADELVRGVHITRLAPDGSGKAVTEDDKITIGRCIGSPIVLAPPTDLLGLAVTEGIEDGLSVHAATGLGVWCAGCASRMPGLADAVPDCIDCITVYAHDDADGKRYAIEFADALVALGPGSRRSCHDGDLPFAIGQCSCHLDQFHSNAVHHAAADRGP